MFDLSGRVAVVTGASSGIGRAIAAALADAAARVVLVARREARLATAAAEIGARATYVVGDVTDHKEVARCIAEPFGAPDILVNAAGVNIREPAEAITPESWDYTLAVNLKAPFFLAQSLVPAMTEKGWGRVINIASLQSVRAFPEGLAYGASKGGVMQLTRAMAAAWSSRGITCNAVAPGFFPTELTEPVFGNPTLAARHAAQTAIGRNGRLEDLHGAAVFLASPASDYITGQTIFVDGGYTAK